MDRTLILFIVATAVVGSAGLAAGPESAASPATSQPPILVVHGGAGTILKANMTPQEEAAYRSKLAESLESGFAILERGGSSLDAVEASLRILEDSPLFNAGKGAVFTADGRNELDAAIMDGTTRSAGAVAGVTTVKNPIAAARAVMERSPHVLLAGPGADAFAREIGLEIVEPSYFFTQRRWDALERAQAREKGARADQAAGAEAIAHLGTVGAVALDRAGRLAAGTSTGGMTNKRFGRIGDSPILGAGTWADERCAVSATGHGEYFIRWAVAHEICSLVRHRDESIGGAAETVIMKTLVQAGGSGGVIALDRTGELAMPFSTEGMYRGWIRAGGEAHVEIYK